MRDVTQTRNKISPPPFDGTLSSLAWPLSADAFMQEAWQQTPVFAKGNEHRLQRIAEIIDFTDIPSVLDLAGPAPIEVFFRNEQGFHEQFRCASAGAAFEHYNAGRTLYFHIDRRSSEIAAWGQSLAASMGLPNITVRASLFLSRCSGGIAPHFDANENFTIQLRGAKTWQIAPNEHLHNPISNYFMGEPVDPGMRAYVHHRLPTSMPENRETVPMQCGSMLYLPGGYWHTTQTTGQESVSLNLVFPRVTWADVFLQSVRPILLQDPRWRARADHLIGDKEMRLSAKPVLEKLIGELSQQLNHFTGYFSSMSENAQADDSIEDEDLFIRNRLVAWCIVQEDTDECLLELRPPLDQPVTATIPAVLQAVWEWAGSTHEVFTYRCLRHKYVEVGDESLRRGVMHMLQTGLLQRVR